MKRRQQFFKSPHNDSGAALVMVLIIVTVIGLAGAAMLTFSDTSLRTTVALRDQAGNTYNADGAAQVAINSLSTGYGFTSPAWFNNATGTTCFGTQGTTLNLQDFYPGTGGLNGTTPSSASVVCTADPATGVNGTVVPITSANRPGQAIMTLGQNSSEDGINVQAPSTNPFAVKGPVRSNSDINVQQGTLQSTAAVTAHDPCSGTIVSTPSANCNTHINLVDPSYASEATVVPAYQPVPADVSASCPNNVVTFKPGYYDDAGSLTALMTGNGPCGGSTWWFTPGTYYFDFHNNTKDPDHYDGAGTASSGRNANRWAITSGNLVAGTPVDSNGTVIGSPGASPTIPGSCQNPIKSTTAAGVQFIFGGDSQLALGGSANAEICGSYHDDRPPIALYGVKSGTATTTTLDSTGDGDGPPLKMSAVPSQTTLFINPMGIKEQGEINGLSTWAKTTAPTLTSTITVTGYAPPSAIPVGSIVKWAKVRVRHSNDQKYVTGTGKDLLTLTLTPKGVTGSPPGPAIKPPLTTPTIDTRFVIDSPPIDAVGTTEFARYVHDHGFTGADMAYTARLSHAGTERLDTMQIEISYVTPAFRSENISTISSNCMREDYSRTDTVSTKACAVLSTSSFARPNSSDRLPNFTGKFYVQGTTYTPKAAIDLTLNNVTQQVLRFGVISRSLWVKTNSFSYSGPVIEIPDDSTGDNGAPIVFLRVYVCPGTSTDTCSTDAGAITALRAKARIIDATPPSKITILSWSNLR